LRDGAGNAPADRQKTADRAAIARVGPQRQTAAMNLRRVVAMLPVTDMTRSLAFYQRLGFDLEDDFVPDGHKTAVWAWLDGGGAMLMINCTAGPLPPPAQRAIYYVYCPDVAEKHAELLAAGINPGPIEIRFYAPQGEFRVEDPDGYVLMFSSA